MRSIATNLLLALLCAGAMACSGGGGAGAPSVPSNSAPIISSSATPQAAENLLAAFTVSASDPNGDAVRFAIAGGADQSLFSININTGAVTFQTAPDFEMPRDANRDNIYELTVSTSDASATATQNVRLTVTNVTGRVATRRVAQGLSQAVFVTSIGDASGRLLVLEKTGLIRVLDPRTGIIESTPFLDLRNQVNASGEQGLLGLALAPDFATSRSFYVYLSNLSGDSEVRRYRTLATTPDRGDPASADLILRVEQPDQFANHKAGWIGFGADNLLYIPLGDGGGGGDTLGNAQNINSLLGKLLRIDVRSDAFPSDPDRDYTIPAGNPFAVSGGPPEIFALGFRNPFRASFDRSTGALFLGDVGQNAIEEIDLVRASDAGANYGWNLREGTQAFSSQSTAGLTPPVVEYSHGSGPLQGQSVTGGYVYRGPIASLAGQYFFADFVSSRIWSLPVSSLTQGATVPNSAFNDRTASFTPDVGQIGSIASFGEDDLANLFIVDFGGEVFQIVEIE
jgi:glucose/arabinose dehydrogenase